MGDQQQRLALGPALQAVAQDVALRAIEVYLEVLKRRELVALARNNLQAHLRVNDQIGLRNERGVGSTADLDQSRARRALDETVVDGINTTLTLHQKIMDDPEFQAGDYTIHWLEKFVAREVEGT